MRPMKKLLIIAVVLALLVVTITPVLVGQVAARFYPELLEASAADDANVAVDVTEFDAGWFGSRARSRVSVTAPAVVNWLAAFDVADPTFEVMDHVRHGLLPFGSGSLSPAYLAGGGPVRHIKGQLDGTFQYRIPLDGEPQVELFLQPVDAEGPMGYWRTNGTRIGFGANAEMDDIELHIEQDALALLGPGADVDLSGGTLDLDWDDGAGTFAIGVSGFRQGDVRLSDFELHGEVVRKDRWLEIHGVFADENFGLGEADYGRLSGKIAVTQLDAAAVDAVFRKLRQPAKDAEHRRAVLLGELMSQAPVLLSHRPRVALSEVTLRGEVGNAEAQGYVSLAPPDLEALRDPMGLLQFLEADLAADIDEPVAKSLMSYRVDRRTESRLQTEELEIATERALQRLRGEGLFVLEDGVYTMRASRESGVTTINGQQLALPNR